MFNKYSNKIKLITLDNTNKKYPYCHSKINK